MRMNSNRSKSESLEYIKGLQRQIAKVYEL